MTQESPMLYKLGETPDEVHINSVEENKNTALSLVTQARHSIDIFSQDMDTEIYNNDEFEQAIFKLAKRHPMTKIRVLTQDSTKAIQNGHRLIKLAQTLTSSVFIHSIPQEFKDEQCAFLVVDQQGLLYRVTATDRNYKANFSFMAPQRAKKLTDFFNEVWEHSTPDIQSRRIYV
jgi:hypothetical protein